MELVSLRIPKEDKEVLQKKAEKDGRTLSNYLRLLIRKEMK